MDAELANKVFSNPLIFPKIAKNLWFKHKLPLRLVSHGFNQQVLALIKSGSFRPVLHINRKHLLNLKITDINKEFCPTILINEPDFDWEEGGKEKEALLQFFLTFQDNVQRIHFQANTHLGIFIFEHIWNKFKLSSLKEVELQMDRTIFASYQDINFHSKETIKKLTTHWKDPALNPLLLNILTATPILQELRLGGNLLPDLRNLALPNLKTFVWGGLDCNIPQAPVTLAILSRAFGQWRSSLEILELYFPDLSEYTKFQLVFQERMDNLRKLTACGVQVWGSLTAEMLPVLEEIYIHSGLPFDGASTVDASLKRILEKWAKERSTLSSVKRVTLCHNLHPTVQASLLKLFPKTEKLRMDCFGCWQIGRGDDSWFSSAGISSIGRGNVEGLVPTQFRAWLHLLERVVELRYLKNLTSYFYIARPFLGVSGDTPESLMEHQERAFVCMIFNGLQILNLIQHRGNHEEGLCLRNRTSRLNSIYEIVSVSSQMKAMTLAEFGFHPDNVQDFKSYIKREKLPVQFVYCERIGHAPI